jgi:hypothetical protein
MATLAAPAAGIIKPAAEASVGNIGGWGNIQQAGQAQPGISQMRNWQNTGFNSRGGGDIGGFE